MKNVIQDYAWGSKEYLQKLTGQGVDGPLAELWMGTHPRGESKVISGDLLKKLSSLIEEDPSLYIGKDQYNSFKGLPFLFKLLAAGDPLSIQVHPSKEQAEEGFLKENTLGVALDAFNRNYKDDNHKPEIICAITDYWAMKGFRELDQIKDNFRPWLGDDLFAKLFQGESQQGLAHFFEQFMTLDSLQKESLLQEGLKWCSLQDRDECRWVLKLNKKYPGDISCFSPLYLNTLCLKPGEALYLPAGELHAYLEGFGVELMANSDNVLRGGLTPKYMDLPELMKTIHFMAESPTIIKGEELQKGLYSYNTPAKEFHLFKIDSEQDTVKININLVSIVVALEGVLTLKNGDETLKLKAGESAFISANSKDLSFLGAKAFMASAVAL